MFRKNLWLLLILMLIPSVVLASDLNETWISMERGMCFGTCPVYEVTIDGNGTVNYNGIAFVEHEGEATADIKPSFVTELIKTAEELGFFEMEDEYINYSITDLPFVTINITANGREKTIVHYHGDISAPHDLFILEDLVDTTANTSQWIGNGEIIDDSGWGEPI